MAKETQEQSLITIEDVTDMTDLFSVALQGAGTNRETLSKLLMFEAAFIARLEATIKFIEENKKDES